MQKRYMSIITACLCLATFLFLPGCGESLFKGLDGDTTSRTAEEANQNGDYARALALSQATIDNPNASTEEKQAAYAEKGSALLGIHAISPLSLTGLLKKTNEANIVDTLSTMFEITPSDSQEIADTFNTAYELGGGSLSALSSAKTSSGSESSLKTNKQLLRGLANLTVVVKMTTRVFDIATEGTVTKTSAVATYEEALDYLMGGSRTVFYYAENALNGFSSANALTQHQLQQAEKIRVVGLNLKNLHTAVKNRQTFRLHKYVNGTATPVTGIDAYSVALPESPDQRESVIIAALAKIFTYIKTT